MTLAEVGALMQWSISTVQRLEVGRTERIRLVDVEALCRIYEFSEEFTQALKGLACQAAGQSWWHEYGDLIPENFDVFVDLESSAQALTWYETELVPGIAQTPAYAHALIRTGYPEEPAAEHERRVKLRMRRQALITRTHAPVRIDITLREPVLRSIIGGSRVMASQLRHLADLSTRPNVTVRILPLAAGCPLGVTIGPFVILEPRHITRRQPPDPTVVYVESYTGDLYLEKPAAVARYARAHQGLRRVALDDERSRIMLRRLAKEYGT